MSPPHEVVRVDVVGGDGGEIAGQHPLVAITFEPLEAASVHSRLARIATSLHVKLELEPQLLAAAAAVGVSDPHAPPKNTLPALPTKDSLLLEWFGIQPGPKAPVEGEAGEGEGGLATAEHAAAAAALGEAASELHAPPPVVMVVA